MTAWSPESLLITPEEAAVKTAKLEDFKLKWKLELQGKDRAERRRINKRRFKEEHELFHSLYP